MIIHVYAVCWNEEVILPYFLRHYGAFADKIFIFDNESSDRSPEIIDACPKATRIPIKTGGTCSEGSQRECKMRYIESRGVADWAILVDLDEFIYHPDILGMLDHYRRWWVTIPSVSGFEMISQETPTGDGQLVEYVKTGVPSVGYSKRVVLSPGIDIEFSPGCHQTKVLNGWDGQSEPPELKLLHYRFLGREFFIRRYAERRERLCAEDRRLGHGHHYLHPDSYFAHLFDVTWRDASPVI
jgi:glycosyltransferase involved in cell wall biosynthesis